MTLEYRTQIRFQLVVRCALDDLHNMSFALDNGLGNELDHRTSISNG
jgi:hypothetical protein